MKSRDRFQWFSVNLPANSVAEGAGKRGVGVAPPSLRERTAYRCFDLLVSWWHKCNKII